MKDTLIVRGRQVTPDDLTPIQPLIKEHWQRGRKFSTNNCSFDPILDGDYNRLLSQIKFDLFKKEISIQSTIKLARSP